MLKRSLMVGIALIALLAAALTMSLPVALAIGEVTATPSPAAAASTATPASLNPSTQPTATAASLNPSPSATPETQTLNPPDNGQALPELSPEVQDLMNKAVDALQNSEYQDTVDLITQALALETRNPDAYIIRSFAYTQLKDYASAVNDMTQAINLLPYSGQLYKYRADAYVGMQENEKALADYTTAIDIDPRYAEAFDSRAQLNTLMGNNDAAEIDSLMATGLSDMAGQDFPGAMKQFDQVIEKDTGKTHTSAVAYYNRGLANLTINKIEDSIADFTFALELYPDMHDAYLGRGIAYRRLNDAAHTGADFLRRIEILAKNTFTSSLEMGQSTDVAMDYGVVYRISFQGHGGDTIAVTASATDSSGVDALVVVLDPSGTPIAGDDDTGAGITAMDSLIDNLRLPADGTYTIVVSHANGGFVGNLHVTVNKH